MTDAIRMDDGAKELVGILHAAGYKAYAVGGCVRDSLLGLVPHDWDLCSSAAPERVIKLFGEKKCIPTGLQHGTVTVKQNGKLYEVTTFRTENAYTDGRHPDSVDFVPDVETDLARRDFTINAMAYNEEEGLIDPFGGRTDLKNGVVRAVGEPNRRFEEDALRIMRLYRFAARFGFEIDAATDTAARALCSRLDCVSAERILDELTRLLMAQKPGKWLVPEVFNVILPELEPLAKPECFAKLKQAVDSVPAGEEGFAARVAVLLSAADENSARQALHRLRCSNALLDEVTVLLKERSFCSASERNALRLQARRLLGRLEPPTLQRLVWLCCALCPEQSSGFEALWNEAAELIKENACCRIKQLAVNGHDLIAVGVRQGPELRSLLSELLELVITEQLPNEREALLREAKRRT